MSSADLISLLGYYFAILALIVTFFSTQLDSWKNRVLALESEWDPAQQESSTQFKIRQVTEKKTLKSTAPLFPFITPIAAGTFLVILGYVALGRADPNVSRQDVELFLLLPSIVVLVSYGVYGLWMILSGKKKLTNLK